MEQKRKGTFHGISRRDFIQNSTVLGSAAYLTGIGLNNTLAVAKPAPVNNKADAKKVVDSISREKLEDAVKMACDWLTDIAQVKTEKLADRDQRHGDSRVFPYTNWKGSIRGEYAPGRSDRWWFFCPIWHTGQAVRALSLAYSYFKDDKYLASAKMGAEFIGNQRIKDKNDPDFGCILAYERHGGGGAPYNTSALLECVDGLYHLSDVCGDKKYAEWANDAVTWTVDKLYKGQGYFHDSYDMKNRKVASPPWRNRWGEAGRPLIDDGVLLKAFQQTGNEKLRKVFYEVADRLLADENPSGNWVNHIPCDWGRGRIHPRHAFWWGRAMWMAYKDSGKQKYRDCFDRATDWYTKAMRLDGGIIRKTSVNFNTASFGHATSGVGAACMMFHDQYKELGNSIYLEKLILGLRYQTQMQVRKADDPNMQGVIIEKVLMPDGVDRVPWMIRDIGTIFFVSSASLTLSSIYKGDA